MNLIFTTLWLMTSLLVLPFAAHSATLNGKATIDGKGVAGIDILVYPMDVIDFNSTPVHRFGPTAADGHFSIELAKGQYYLFARGQPGDTLTTCHQAESRYPRSDTFHPCLV